jgi:hypothetical protein
MTTKTKTAGVYDIVCIGSIYEVLGWWAGRNTQYQPFYPPVYAEPVRRKRKIFSSNFSLENYDSTGHTSGALVHTISVDVPSYSLINYQNQSSTVSRVKTEDD